MSASEAHSSAARRIRWGGVLIAARESGRERECVPSLVGPRHDMPCAPSSHPLITPFADPPRARRPLATFLLLQSFTAEALRTRVSDHGRYKLSTGRRAGFDMVRAFPSLLTHAQRTTRQEGAFRPHFSARVMHSHVLKTGYRMRLDSGCTGRTTRAPRTPRCRNRRILLFQNGHPPSLTLTPLNTYGVCPWLKIKMDQ